MIPARTKDSQTADPATSPAAPRSEKMPAPTMAATPMKAACGHEMYAPGLHRLRLCQGAIPSLTSPSRSGRGNSRPRSRHPEDPQTHGFAFDRTGHAAGTTSPAAQLGPGDGDDLDSLLSEECVRRGVALVAEDHAQARRRGSCSRRPTAPAGRREASIGVRKTRSFSTPSASATTGKSSAFSTTR